MREGENPETGNVNGYRKLTDEELSAINRIKEAGNGTIAKLLEEVGADPALNADKRALALANTKFEEAFFYLVKAVAKPTTRF